MIRNSKSILGAVSILAMVGVSGCSSAPSTNSAPPRATAKTVSPFIHVLTTSKVQITSSEVIGVIGSYAGCTGQSATQWVLDTAGNAGVMEANNPGLVAPAIELDDDDCVLSITTISTSTDGYTVDESSSLPFTGPAPVAANAYLPTAAAFDDPNNDGVLGFYANAQSTITDGTASFSVTLLLGDDPNIGSTSATATVQTVSGGIGVSDVLPPDYATDLSGLALFDDVNGVASTVSGTITLDFESQAGENYLVFHNQDLSTDDFASIDSAWNTAISDDQTINSIPSGNGNVSVDPTTLVTAGPPGTGDQLPVTSTILVQHVDSASNVPVYEVIAITFNEHGGT